MNKKYKTVIVFLMDLELKKLEKHSFSQNRLEQIKNLFVFYCYTGLAYAEMSTLTTKNIEIEVGNFPFEQLYIFVEDKGQ